jgi:hypothetical protein
VSEAVLSDRYASSIVRVPGTERVLPEELPPGITLQVYGRTRGFLARVYRGRVLRKLFSWGAHGGVQAALEAAVAWQRAQSDTWPPEPRERKRVPGYGYVQRGQRSYRDGSGALQRYEAFIAWFWDGEGRPNQTSYSIPEHGEAEAEARCYAWLDRQRAALGL